MRPPFSFTKITNVNSYRKAVGLARWLTYNTNIKAVPSNGCGGYYPEKLDRAMDEFLASGNYKATSSDRHNHKVNVCSSNFSAFIKHCKEFL